jgi:hypothetical protein
MAGFIMFALSVMWRGMINESIVERTLVDRLKEYGFKVLKLYTPGSMGTMDRMILRPVYSPGPPMFVELKRPKARLRRLQTEVAKDWRKRGAEVLEPCTTIGEVDQLCTNLISDVWPDYVKYNEAN